jgi:hypothetical protein
VAVSGWLTEHLDHGHSLTELAAENGTSLRCAYRWLARYHSGGPASLADRWSVLCTLRRISWLQLVPISTLARAMRRLGLNRLRNLDPKPPVLRYRWEQTGDMIHVDTKQLAGSSG